MVSISVPVRYFSQFFLVAWPTHGILNCSFDYLLFLEADCYSKALDGNQEKYFVKSRMAFTISWIASCISKQIQTV
jgi:hypothetical protein